MSLNYRSIAKYEFEHDPRYLNHVAGRQLRWLRNGSPVDARHSLSRADVKRIILAPGDLLRQIEIPLVALKRRAAFRQISLTPVGRSAALLIGSLSSEGAMALTVTASTARPVQLAFSQIPDPRELREAIRARISDGIYHDDVHGKPAWRKHMTLRLAEEIRAELQGLV